MLRHTGTRPKWVFVAYARDHHLLVSAGSDSHGRPGGQMPIKYPAEACRDLLARLGIALG